MATEVVLLICISVGLWYFKSSRKQRRRYFRQRSKPIRHHTVSRRYRQTFDHSSSKPVGTQRELVGRAYGVDGDTIVIKRIQVRLFGIDAPEMNHPYGKKSKWAMVALCKGQIILAEVTEQDTHGRTVAKCYLPDGRDLSAELVKAGLAIDWPKFSGGIYRHLEVPDARKKMWLADARQKGRMHVWEKFEARQKHNSFD